MSSGKGKDGEKKPVDGTVRMGGTGATGAATDALLGQKLDDRYLLRLVLGEGGMGKVYLADDEKLKKRVALKLMGARLTAQPEFRARFEREAVLQANLPHPQIIQIQDLGECAEGAYIVMEYSDGRSLSRLIRELGPRPLDKALAVIEQILEVLDFAHGQGVIHRDLKPSNILIEERPGREIVRLLDFGIAKLLGDGGASGTEALTRTGFAYGTMGYMAPEQARGESDKIDHRADLYSIGIMLYEMLTGDVPAPPDSRSHPVRYAMWCQENSIAPLAESHPDLGLAEQIDTILARALKRDPAERYPSALAFLRDVREFREHASARTMTRPRTPPTKDEKLQEPAPPRRAALAGWVVSAVLLIALMYGYTLWKDAEDRASRGGGGGDTAELETARRAEADAERRASAAEGRASQAEADLKRERSEWTRTKGALESAKDKAEGERDAERSAKDKAEAAAIKAEGERDSERTAKEGLQAELGRKERAIAAKDKEIARLEGLIGGGNPALESQIAELRKDKVALEKQVAELEKRPTAEAHSDALAQKRAAERDRDQANRNLATANQTAMNANRELGKVRGALGAMQDWVRAVANQVASAVPSDRWPPPGMPELAVRPDRKISLQNVTRTKITIKRIEAMTPSGNKILLSRNEDLLRNETYSVTDLPPGTTALFVRYDSDWDANARQYKITGKGKTKTIPLGTGDINGKLDGR